MVLTSLQTFKLSGAFVLAAEPTWHLLDALYVF
jgi:hypothetical protein